MTTETILSTINSAIRANGPKAKAMLQQLASDLRAEKAKAADYAERGRKAWATRSKAKGKAKRSRKA